MLTTGALVRAREVLLVDIVDAAKTYAIRPSSSPQPIGAGYRVDVAAAVAAVREAERVFADPDSSLMQRQDAAEAAILLARPRRSRGRGRGN